MPAESGFDRGIAKGAVPVVDEQLTGRGLIELGMTIVTVPVAFADGVVVDVPFQVVDYDEVEQAVVVHVHPGGGDGPERSVLGVGLVEAGLGGDVGEGSVAVVVIERVAINAGHEDVFVPVIVVVADGDADVVSGSGEARFFCHVSEVSVAVVFEEAIGIFRGIFFQRFYVGAVAEEDVKFAVVVVVEDRHAACHGFGRVALRSFAAVQLEVDGLVGELDRAVGDGLRQRGGLFRRRLWMQSRLRH